MTEDTAILNVAVVEDDSQPSTTNPTRLDLPSPRSNNNNHNTNIPEPSTTTKTTDSINSAPTSNQTSDEEQELQKIIPPNPNDKRYIFTHYIFLVHGWMGDAKEMSYVEQSLDERINHQQKKTNSNNNSNDNDNNNKNRKNKKVALSRIKVHSSTCNGGKTSDGVIKGGKRLSNEIQEYIRNDILNQQTLQGNDTNDNDKGLGVVENEIDVTLSLVGNSLGGLYARYSLSCIPSKMTLEVPTVNTFSSTDPSPPLSTTEKVLLIIHLHPNIFITTVTPHLGLANNCSFQTSQSFEHISAYMTGQSGLDLFLLDHEKKAMKFKCLKRKGSTSTNTSNTNNINNINNNDKEKESILFTMATDYQQFLKPLLKFQKRIAYINSFHTDFQVHTSTAGFLSKKSTYPHRFSYNDSDHHSHNNNCHPFIIDTSTTEQNQHMAQSKTPSYKQINGRLIKKRKQRIELQNLIMSNKLDALGWTKVFIDSRAMNPIKTLRKPWYSNTSRNVWDSFSLEIRNSQSNVQFRSSSINDRSEERKQFVPSTLLISGRLNSPRNSSAYGEGSFDEEEENEDDDNDNDVSIDVAEAQERCKDASTFTVTSKDIFHYMTLNEQIQVPVGHGLAIANSKSPCCEKFHRNGRPIVDYIVENLVNNVIQFRFS